MNAWTRRDWLYVLAYIPLYVALDWVSFIHPVGNFAITPWNPPPALSLALLLRLGPRVWPALLTAGLLAEWLVRGMPSPPLISLLAVSITTLGHVLAAHWLRRRLDTQFQQLRSLAWFLGISAVITLPIAASYVGMLWAAGLLAAEGVAQAVLVFWIGDVLGIIVLLPLLLVHGAALTAWRPRRPATESVLQALALLATLWLVFGWEFTDEFKYFYLLFMPLTWIAVRHGMRGATPGLLAAQLALIAFVHVDEPGALSMLEFQMLMLALSVTSLFLGMIVSERQRLENAYAQRDAQLHHALRLAAASEMTSALAHELNQPLSAIASYARVASLLFDAADTPRDQMRSTLSKIEQEAARAGSVVHKLREFFRSGGSERGAHALSELVQGAYGPLRRRAEQAQVELVCDIPADLPPLDVDRVQMETVLHNLLGNAVDALREHPGPRRIQLGARRDDAWARITVSDNGPGIPEDIRSDIFEPFMSSKSEGLGLGLNISRSIAEAHGGSLLLDSEAKHTCFVLRLPLMHEPGHVP
ncbi:MAG: MASE1 domain-containing protein [Gammaproteobacteria bacterium]|nr:MASE1 domain-containing protein [Gammaproteobacteria bacterium]